MARSAERERDDARDALAKVIQERDEAVALLREATSDRCVVCHADLQPSMTVPPHCEDCIADDDACCDHGDRVNDFRARLDAALGKGGGKLADEIERFKAIERHRDHLHDCLQRAERERDEAQARVEDYHRSLVAQSALLHTTSNERDDLRALLTAVAQSGVEWSTPGYVVVQVDRATWAAITGAPAPARTPAVSGFDFPPEVS